MKRQTTLSIALALCLLLSSTGLVPTAHGQQPQMRYRAGVGPIQLGENQAILLTLSGGVSDTLAGDENVSFSINFVKITFAAGECSGDNTCKLTMTSRSTSGPLLVEPGEAVSTLIEHDGGGAAVSLNFWSDSRKVQANALIVDKVTAKSLLP